MKKGLLILLSVMWLINFSAYSKPSVPVSVSIETQGDVVEGQPAVFVVTANSRISVDRLQINIQLPDNIKLESGSLSWQGSVLSNQPVTMSFSVLLPENGEPIVAEAIIKGNGNSRIMGRAVYHYDKSAIFNKTKPKSRQLYRGDRKIIEFPVNIPGQ